MHFLFLTRGKADKESPAVRPFPPSTSLFQFLSSRSALVGNFRTEFCKARMKEVLFCLPSKLTVAFAILGNYPIIVPTCCSNAIFKVTSKRTHGCTAKLLRDDTLLPHPQPAEVQKSCCGNHAGTRIFLTWFYILTLKDAAILPSLTPQEQLPFRLFLSPSLLSPSPRCLALLALSSTRPGSVGASSRCVALQGLTESKKQKRSKTNMKIIRLKS